MARTLGTIFGSSTTAVIGASAVVAIAVLGASLFGAFRSAEMDTTAPAAPATESAAGQTPADPAATDAETADPSPEPASAPAPDIEVAPPVPPRFDVVRIDAFGSAVIAGQTEALTTVRLNLDGDVIREVQSDAGGNFVVLMTIEPSDALRVLSLQAMLENGDTLSGAQTVLISPFSLADEGGAVAAVEVDPAAPPGPTETVDAAEVAGTSDPTETAETADPTETAEVAGTAEPTETAGTAGPTEVAGTAEPTETADAAAVAGTADPTETADAAGTAVIAEVAGTGTQPRDETVAATAPADPSRVEPAAPQVTDVAAAPAAAPEAPAIVLADESGVRLLQGPGSGPQVQTEVALDAITYDSVGAVTLAGRGPAEASLRVTLDNRPVQLGEVSAEGQWSLNLPDVDPGTYTLRVQEIAADGSVESQVETPFLREDPQRIVQDSMLVAAGSEVITVQPGFTLWGIAQANFGEGLLYVQIFQENREEIRDPDLIFPGQIFQLPDLPRIGGGQ